MKSLCLSASNLVNKNQISIPNKVPQYIRWEGNQVLHVAFVFFVRLKLYCSEIKFNSYLTYINKFARRYVGLVRLVDLALASNNFVRNFHEVSGDLRILTQIFYYKLYQWNRLTICFENQSHCT